MNMSLGKTISQVETFTDAQGEPAYYIVDLDPAGFVIVSADTDIDPIIGFLPEGTYNPSQNNPLGALVSNDLPSRLAAVRASTAAPGLTKAVSTAQSKWAMLSGVKSLGASPTMSAVISDVRVPPLVQSKWDQDLAGGNGPVCYNYYTPNNYVCGCVATAMAQLMRYWQSPTSGIGVHSYSITVDGTAQNASTRGGDGNGGPYNWSQMPLVPNSATTVTQCQAIGALCYDAGIAAHMSYSMLSSGTWMADAGNALRSVFHYSNVIVIEDLSRLALNTGVIPMVNPGLDAACPSLLAIYDASGSGHAIVVDGYGYNTGTLFHHLNLGWNGQSDAWYNLPTIDTQYMTFNVVTGCVFNVFSTGGGGEIISGRVLDAGGSPISGATVQAAGNGTVYTATTNAKGIYAVTHVPSATTFTVNVIGDYASQAQSVSTGRSVSGTNGSAVGNVWGVDFSATPSGPPKVKFESSNFTFNRDAGSATITVVLTGA